MHQSYNPYSVLFETISFDNVQKMGELITLKTLRGSRTYSKYVHEWLYLHYIRDLNHKHEVGYVLSDAYDLAQTVICFLCEFIGKNLDDVYTVQNGKTVTIRRTAYNLVNKHICRIHKKTLRSKELEIIETKSVDIEEYQEKDYTVVDNKIEKLNLKPTEREVLDCYMAGMTCYEIAELLEIDRTTVFRRRMKVQIKYKALF